jgi:parallel beta-helix repeat protein
MKKIAFLVFMLGPLFLMTVVIHFSAPAKAESKTIYVDAKNTGSEDGTKEHPYNTIKEGINAATSGDTIFVWNGTYLEWNIVLDKDNLSLVGENRDITIIDGSLNYWILIVKAQNVTVTGFTIRNSPIGTAGIFLNHATRSRISKNIIKNHDSGIYSIFSNDNLIENNWVSDTYAGIILSSVCRENKISKNDVKGNIRGIDLSNGAHNNEIENNNIVQNTYGISISPDNNSILGNQILNNDVGIYEDSESTRGYQIFHNNLVNNTKQVDLSSQSKNIWDNGLEGNYWGDYNGTDFTQDGIGDTLYFINGNNTDHKPLMGPFSDFPVTWEQETYHVNSVCNSTISAFQFDQANKAVRFNVTGKEMTLGFCRIVIPKALMNYTVYTVLVDGNEPTLQKELPCSNSTHEYLYFTYIHSTCEVTITPEFPKLALTLLVIVVLTIFVTICKQRFSKPA